MVAVETKDIKGTLLRYWSTDADLVSKWHVAAPASLEECVERSLLDLQTVDPETFRLYEITDNNDAVGFFGTERDCYLTTFFVKTEYRKRSHMGDIWSLVQSHFPGEFLTAIHRRNTRAAKFYEKNGCEVQHGGTAQIFKLRNKEKQE